MGWTGEATESSEYAAVPFRAKCAAATHYPPSLVVLVESVGPKKGARVPAILKRRGVLASIGRPSVSKVNSFSEALSRTAECRPLFPREPFTELAHASARVKSFVHWHNHEHRYSAIRFVTTAQRHYGQNVATLALRERIYARLVAHRNGRANSAGPDGELSSRSPNVDSLDTHTRESRGTSP